MARKLKIEIYSPEEKTNIKIHFPFWLIKFLSHTGINVFSIAKKYSSNKHLDKITKDHIKLIKLFTHQSIKELKKCESFNLVDIESSDGEIVKISVI